MGVDRMFEDRGWRSPQVTELRTQLGESEKLLRKIHDILAKVDIATKEDTISDILWLIDYYFEAEKDIK